MKAGMQAGRQAGRAGWSGVGCDEMRWGVKKKAGGWREDWDGAW